MKKFITLVVSILLNMSLFAQTQYDYYDDGAVAGGVDRALNGIIIIAGLVVVVVVILLILGGAAKIYNWFNPEANPEYKRQMAIKKDGDGKHTENLTQEKSSPKANTNHNPDERDNLVTTNTRFKSSNQKINTPQNTSTTIEKDGFIISFDGKKLIKGNNTDKCHIPVGVEIIRRHSFENATDIRTLYIPDTVEEVEDFAFSSMKIESVYIPKSIKKWGESAFFMCTKLKEVFIEDGLKVLGKNMFMCCKEMDRIVFPESIKYIPEKMFYECKALKDINFPSSLVGIGDSAFYRCESIERIKLPSTLVGLSDDTFSDCYSLSEVTIPEGVTVISSRCFARCNQIKKIRIPTTIQHIDDNAFVDCYELSLEVPRGTATKYRELNLDGVSAIVEYDAEMSGDINELKAVSEKFIKIQNYKREQNDYEFRKEMGLLTKEEYDRENAWRYDFMDDPFDDYDDF